MDQFLFLRKQFMLCKDGATDEKYQCHYRFYQSFMADTQNASVETEKSSYLKFLSQEPYLANGDIFAILPMLGDDIYCDDYIKDLLRQHRGQIPRCELTAQLQSLISDQECGREKLMCVLDISAEHRLPVLSAAATQALLEKFMDDTGVVIALLAYIEAVHRNEFQGILTSLWQETLPAAIRVELCALLGENTPPFINEGPAAGWFADFKACLSGKNKVADSSFTIVQFMFYGDIATVGEANSGGLGTFLRSLGGAMALQGDVGSVVTIALHNTQLDQKWLPVIEEIEPSHFLLRVPVFLEREGQTAFIGMEYMLRRSVLRMLRCLNSKPGILHVRYLDNAAKAMINLGEELGIPVVATLTPDPHRSVTDNLGEISHTSVAQAIERIHKIYLGDYIVEHVQGILGIGGAAMKEELISYFPELPARSSKIPFACIPEGIRLANDEEVADDVLLRLTDPSLTHRLSDEMADRPLIVNVGRLNEVKGQNRLLNAWGNYDLWKHYNLLFIGGNLNNPTTEEQQMIATIEKYLLDHPGLSGRFCHLSACDNKTVRQMERAIARHGQGELPNLYVCSSLKEEFGISIMEAMEAGLIVMAPRKGGAHTYIRHGENGFLIETQTAKDLYRGIHEVLFNSPLSKEQVASIRQRAKETIERSFSIQQIAAEMVDFYHTVTRAAHHGL
jgi:glycosyltransferase involved in cell wall biosynthesis